MILSIDCGTQSLRAILFSFEGEIVDKEQVFYEAYYGSEPGYAEQNANEYWKSLCKATNTLHKRNTELFKEVSGVGVTTLRSTMVNVGVDGNVLRPSMLWLDQRVAKNVYKPSFGMNLVFKTIGVDSTLKKMEGKGHCNWIRQNQPEIWNKTHKYIQVSGFLNYKLSGEFSDSVASQIGHIPFNYNKQRWAKPNDFLQFAKELYPVEKEKLPRLINPGDKIGKITEEAFKETSIPVGIPIIACGSDKGCETLGMGVTDSNNVSLSFGTTATVQTTTSKYIEPKRFFPSYPSVIPQHWNPEIEIFRGFWMINWFKNEFALKEVLEAKEKNVSVEKVLDGLLHKSPPGAMGLIVQPYWSPGLGEKNAKGSIIGFGDVHKKEHIYRSVIEGLAYAMLDGMHKLEKRVGKKFNKIAVSGGASQSDEVCQITADVFNMKLVRGKTHETSGLGAAIITAYGIGAFNSLEVAKEEMVDYSDTFIPNPQNTKLYKDLYEDVYLKIYDKLDPLYKRIREITSYPKL